MLPRFHWTDISTVGHYLGVFIILTGMFMAIPALVALLFGEARSCSGFVLGMGLCFLCGALLRFLKADVIDRRCSLLLTGLSWLVIGIFAAVPLYFTGDFASPVDAVFDAVSSLTTTGISLVEDVDRIGYAHVVWRAILTLFGGQAVIFIAMYLGFTGEGGSQMRNKQHTSRGDRMSALGLSWKFIGACASFYIVVGTLVAFGLGLYLGLRPVDSLVNGFCLTATALNTGGFVPHSSGIIYYHSIGVEVYLTVFMLIGAINFGIFGYAMRFNWRQLLRNSELRTFGVWVIALVVFVTAALTRDGTYTSLEGLFSNGAYMVISAATTGGMQSVYPQQFGGALTDGVLITLSVVVLFGACSQSTGGGIKIIRVMQVLRWIGYSILRKLTPDSARIRIRYEHFGTKQFNARDAMRAMTVFILYVVFAAAGAMVFIAHGNDALQSVFESVSLVSNNGATAGLTSPDMTLDLKIVAMLLMWLGRLEFIAIFAVIAGICMSLSPSNLFGQRSRDRELRRKKRRNKGGTAWRRRRQQEEKKAGGSARVRADEILGFRRYALAQSLYFNRNTSMRSGATLLAIVLAGALVAAPCALAAQSGSQSGNAAVGTGGGVSAQDVSGLSDTSFYRKMSVEGMLSATSRLEGEGVRFSGEAIGDPITADSGHKWVNVKQDDAMIGVYVTNEQAEEISHWGKSGTTGDTVSVRGTFHLACADHMGQLEVHGDTLEVTDEGGALPDAGWSRRALIAGAVMAALGLAITIVQRVAFGKRRLRRPRFE